MNYKKRMRAPKSVLKVDLGSVNDTNVTRELVIMDIREMKDLREMKDPLEMKDLREMTDDMSQEGWRMKG